MHIRVMLYAAVFSLLAGTFSQAAIITTPTSLAAGTQYRLAFVTSGLRNATSTNIADYNSFVTTAANNVLELAALGTTWSAIASTVDDAARDNTSTHPGASFDGPGVPIFQLDDTKLADGNDDLWDGSIDTVFSVTEVGLAPVILVWTGTGQDGVGLAGFELGSSVPRNGLTFQSSAFWIDRGAGALAEGNLPLYAISGVLTVSVPEPSAIVLSLLMAMCTAAWMPRLRNRS